MRVTNPYNNEVIGEIALSNKEQAFEIIESAKLAKTKMRDLSSFEKATILKQIVRGIREHFHEFVQTIAQESGKPMRYAKGEVERAIQTFTVASEECKRLPHELFDIDGSLPGKNLKGEYVYFPRGIIFGISPFNFPINLAVHKIAPAIATGCPIILKPSSKTPLTMELLAKVIAGTDLPKGGFSLLHCSREVGDELVKNTDIDVLSFTGSPEVGWNMKAMAGKKHVVLELGGNAAAILAHDAKVEKAVYELVIGGFAYSGQVCIHTQRIYVHASIYKKFVEKYVAKAAQLIIGNPINEETEFGVMIDEKNAERIEKWVNEAIAAGAEKLLGGQRSGALYPPTILTQVPKGQKVRDEEVFGPVVVIESYDSLENAIAEVNDSRWGLQASIYTDSISIRNQVFQELEVGAVIHNKSTTFRVDDMPYGGIKDSGFGREGVRYAMLDYLEPKLLIRE